MKTIEEIKEECRRIIELGELSDPAPWTYKKSVAWPDCGSVPPVTTDDMGLIEETNAQFIAASRSFTPRAAKVLLDLIAYVEKDTGDGEMSFTRHRGNAMLESLRATWEESK